MTDREALYDGLSNAAWGYFLLTFDVNLGTVSVLPRFAGWLLLMAAAGKLSGEQRDLALLRPLCVLLALWNGADWLLSWGGGGIDGRVVFLDLLTAAAGLYFHFQFLTDLAALAERHQPEGSGLSAGLLRRRTVFTLLITAIALLQSLSQAVPWEGWSWLILAAAAAACIAALMMMASLFSLRRCVRGRPEEPRDGG